MKVDVIMCLKSPDMAVLDLVVRRIRQQPEVNRIIFVISTTGELLPFVDWSEDNLWHGDSIIHESISLSYARKIGIQQSRTDFISFVDHDVLIPTGFFKKCLAFLKIPVVGGVNGQSIDTEWVSHGIKPQKRQIETLARGLCTANLIERELVTDWNPPLRLQALEDFHMTQHIANKGKIWLQIPHYVLHMSFGEDMQKRWLWNAAGFRLIKEMGLGHKLPHTYSAPSSFWYLFWRFVRFFTFPYFYYKYGTNAKAILFEWRFQFNLMKGFLACEKYLQSRRTGYERLETDSTRI